MVDKRLRVLDQDVEIDYWRVGLGLVRGGGGGCERVGDEESSDVVVVAAAEGRSQAFGSSSCVEEGFWHSSASTPSVAARAYGRARVLEPRLKVTLIVSLSFLFFFFFSVFSFLSSFPPISSFFLLFLLLSTPFLFNRSK